MNSTVPFLSKQKARTIPIQMTFNKEKLKAAYMTKTIIKRFKKMRKIYFDKVNILRGRVV